MSNILERAKAMLAVTVAAFAGQIVPRRVRFTGWYGVHPAQRSRHRVAMDKRAAMKARNVAQAKRHA